MIVTPAPVGLLIVVFELGKVVILAMVLFCPHTIRLIFMIIPFMIVIVLFVVVGSSGLVFLGSQRCWRDCYRDHKGSTQQGRIPETGHIFITLLSGYGAILVPSIRWRP